MMCFFMFSVAAFHLCKDGAVCLCGCVFAAVVCVFWLLLYAWLSVRVCAADMERCSSWMASPRCVASVRVVVRVVRSHGDCVCHRRLVC